MSLATLRSRLVLPARIACMLGTMLCLALTARHLVVQPEARAAEPLAAESAQPWAVVRRAAPDSLAATVAARDLFRATRAPAAIRFDPRASQQPAVPIAVPPRPAFVLAGILSGNETAALVDGIPGAESTRLVRAGERFGDYVIRSILNQQVVIAGRDTTWTLRVRTRFP